MFFQKTMAIQLLKFVIRAAFGGIKVGRSEIPS